MTESASPGRLRRLFSTIRFRITALAVLAVLLVLTAASVGVVTAQRRLLTDNLDENLKSQVDELEALVASGMPSRLSTRGDEDTIMQVVADDGSVIAANATGAGLDVIAEPPDADRDQSIRSTHEIPSEGGGFRLLARRVDTPDGPVVIYIAATLDDIRDSTRILAASLLVAVPLAALVLALLVWWLVGRTLRPVEAIRSEVADIGGSELDRRVPEPGSGDEIDRLALTMNAMLDRVEESSRRQQAFVADASHELRTPLTRIRAELEVDAAHPTNADLAATHHSVLEETIALQRLVDDLLYLARSEGSSSLARRDPVDLDDVVLAESSRLRVSANVSVDTTGVTAARLLGDSDQLTRLVRNLVDNAARHAEGVVTITLRESGESVELAVSDDGPGIPPADRERIFERFTRLDEARTSTTGGVGLGLAIARDIAERHGGSVVLDPSDSGARFVVTLPSGET